MKNFILFTLLVLLGSFSIKAQVVYEDFEGGTADISWEGLNGTYNGVVANPDLVGNSSAFVGSYTNAPAFDFCFALGTLAAPADLSKFNLLKMKIWSPTAPAKALLKFEGGGNSVEKIIDITEANKWVEYEFDLSAGAAKTGMNKVLVSFNSFVLGDDKTYYFDDIVAVKNERCYADFETPGLVFQGLDGMLTAPVANPGANQINSSDSCAMYVKSGMHAYSLILADNGAPFDLTTYNQFRMKIYATAPTKVLMKLEGAGGNIERIKNIAVTNAWQEYTFDFSAQAANTDLSKVIIFFDPGTETSTDTYYFDDVCAVPNACVGVMPDPEIIEDFECNRNATYASTWDSLYVVANPHVNGDNLSSKVGEYRDGAGVGSEWSALVLNNNDPIDLTVRNQFSVQVWAPKTGKLLLKLEGGPNPAKEVFVDVTEINKWVTYTGDFSDQAGKGHKHFVLFFNASVEGVLGDIYYFDNVTLKAAPTAPPLEDFEGGVHLGWQALDQNEPIHGVFTGPTANPSPNSVNNSAEVGCYAKGTSAFSTLQAFSLDNFDLSVYAQFNLDVLSPATGGKVTMQLNSPTQGNKEAEATVTTPGEWETLKFDFSAFDAITDFAEIRLVFNAGTAAPGESWCVDNLRQSEVTVDPCANTVPVPNIIDDFECQRNYVQIYYGADDLKVVNNPHLTPENGSLKVGEYKDPAGAGTEFAGIGIELPQAPDLSVYSHLQMQVWAPTANVPFMFKLEGSGQGVEIFDTLTEANKWYKFDIDFSAYVGTGHNKVVIFFNVLSPTGGGTYYVDNIRWGRANYTGCVSNFETPLTSLSNFTYFNNGAINGLFEIVDNPTPAGANTSSKVGKFVESADAGIYFGMYSDLEAFIDFQGNKTIKMKVLMDHIGEVTVKNEIFGNAVPAVEVTLPNTKINEWEELTFNVPGAPDVPGHNRFTIFFDIGTTGTGTNVVSYFDDIVIGAGTCGISSVFQPLSLEAMKVMPNPVSNFLQVENFQDISRIDIYNMLGRRVASLNTAGNLRTEIDVTRFAPGMYQLTGFNAKGQPIGYAKFVKQ